MIKYIDVPTVDTNGNDTVQYLDRDDFTKTAAYENYPEDFKKYADNLEEKPGKGILLISALGDWNWGNNRNADLWPRPGLANDTPDFGYKTYETLGKYYHQHKNKDPKKAYGDVLKSFWDPRMGRVLLIVEVDLKKDEKTKRDLELKIPIPTSMGARVKYDICNVCHPNYEEFYKIPEEEMREIATAKSLKKIYEIGDKHGVDLSYIKKLRDDGGPIGIHTKVKHYCTHMKNHRNELMPNGIRVAVVNLRPRFFDISRVTKNADKSSYVLMKVASDDDVNDMITNDEELVIMLEKQKDELEKQAEKKKKDKKKKSKDEDMEKEAPSGKVEAAGAKDIQDYVDKHITPEMRFREKELPDDVVEEITRFPLNEILSTFVGAGMFPHPREFQRIVLIQSGKSDLDEELKRNKINITEKDVREAPKIDSDDITINGGHFNHELMEILREFLPERSYHRPIVIRRIGLMKTGNYPVNEYSNPIRQDEIRQEHNPGIPVAGTLASIAAMYGLARSKAAGPGLKEAVKKLGRHKTLLGAGLLGTYIAAQLVRSAQREEARDIEWQNRRYMHGKTAMEKKAGKWNTIAALLGAPFGSYIYSGHVLNKARAGQPLNTFEKTVLKHPMMTGIGASLAIHNPSRNAIFRAAKGALKGLSKGASENLGNLTSKEQDLLIIKTWEDNFGNKEN